MPVNVSAKRIRAGRLIGPDERAKALERLKRSISTTEIEIVPIASLTPNPRNAKLHPEKQKALLSKGMLEFGIHSPPVIDERGMILCGHARADAAKLLGLEDLPVIRIPGLTAPQKSALAIADNKMAELGEYDLDILGEELALLYDAEINLDFDPSITGFDTVELDQLILDRGPDAADAVEPPSTSKPAVTQLGDVWHCGAHKLICGNALLTATYDALMGDEQAQIVFTDPPYNVSNSGHVSKRDGVREFAMAHSEMSSDEFTTFLSTACTMMRRYSADGAVVFICMDWRHLPELWAAAGPVLGPPKNTIVWVKTNAGMGSFYRSQHELVLPYVVGSRSPINNFGLGAKGRYRTNVWQYPGLNSFGRDRDVALASHPTVKPVALVADALKDCSHRGGVVLDPFAGSGTTMVAAERTGRSARLIEIDPYYCDVAVRRWEAFSKKSATLAATGQSFTDVAKSRSSREA